MPHRRITARSAFVAGALAFTVTGCGTAGNDERAFCDALGRYDAAAAKALFDTGQVDMKARSGDGKCQPAMDLFDRARPGFAVFTAMAVTVAKQEGIATSCWTSSNGSSRKGSTGGGQRCPIEAAALNGNPEVMRALIAGGASLTNATALGALSDAVTSGSMDTLKLMIDGGASKNAAFSAAIAQAKPEMIAYLEGIGAAEEADPFLVAARTGDLAAIDAGLARRADLEMEDAGGRTPVMRAAMFGRDAVITRLARAGAKLDTRLESDTPVHMAVRGNHADAVRALATAGANLNARADAGSPTPVILAVQTGQVRALAALVDAKADVNVGLESDTTAIGRAIELGNLALVKELLRGGARVNDKGGPGWQPPIHETLNNCGLPPEGPGENDNFRMNMLKTLVGAGADPRAVNDKGETALAAITRLRAEVEPYDAHDPQGFRKACFQAKLDYLKGLR